MIEIRSMTATFGKLNNETLTLQPGMNVFTAPNEWGKSTWCAFLMAMFYGIDTSQRAKAGVIPDKERYKPWSGAPMEGRMDLIWNGRSITIQRQSRGRTPMGVFRAWETDSGADVPDLTAESCGVKLLGVERSVFQRSALIRQSDFPITADDALSRRLNALVTTGDESATGPALGRYLRDLRNRCRHNQTGQLPQAERKRRELQQHLDQIDALEAQESLARGQLRDLTDRTHRLEQHLAWLDSRDAEAKQQRLNAACQVRDLAKEVMEEAEAACKGLLGRQELARELDVWEQRQHQRHRIEGELAALGPAPEPPRPPEPFRGMSPQEAKEYVQRLSREEAQQRQKQGAASLVWCLAGLSLILVGLALTFTVLPWGWILSLIGAAVALWGIRQRKKAAAPLPHALGSLDDAQLLVQDYERGRQDYERQLNQWRTQRQRMELRQQSLSQEESGPTREELTAKIAAWDALDRARKEYQSASTHCKALAAMAGDTTAQDPGVRDVGLTLDREETRRALQDNSRSMNQLTRQAEQCRGQAMALGDRDTISATMEELDGRIAQLNDLYAAASFALAALESAENQLRSRFAPKIAQQAGENLARLTQGRYDAVVLESDWNLQLAAREEATLRPAKLRSDGTLDQIYLALRLAVADALLPEGTPLILDDAFVRFDDTRLKSALNLLWEEAKSRQILLLSCQNREQVLLDQAHLSVL